MSYNYKFDLLEYTLKQDKEEHPVDFYCGIHELIHDKAFDNNCDLECPDCPVVSTQLILRKFK